MVTKRMKWIVGKMKKHAALIQEHRDAFLELSEYWLEWREVDTHHAVRITKTMHGLCEARLIVVIDRQARHTKDGEFITTERTWGLPGGR